MFEVVSGRRSGKNAAMNTSPVSIHPYFKIHPGKVEDMKALLPKFIEKTSTESKVLYYEFTLNGEELYCREAYQDAEGVLLHLKNVEELLEEAEKYTEISRIEMHGPAAELEKLKEALPELKVAWFETIGGLER